MFIDRLASRNKLLKCSETYSILKLLPTQWLWMKEARDFQFESIFIFLGIDELTVYHIGHICFIHM